MLWIWTVYLLCLCHNETLVLIQPPIWSFSFPNYPANLFVIRTFEKVPFCLLFTIYWPGLCSFKMLVIKEKMFILETTCLALKTSMVTASMGSVNSSIRLRRLLVGRSTPPGQRWGMFPFSHCSIESNDIWIKYYQKVIFICNWVKK